MGKSRKIPVFKVGKWFIPARSKEEAIKDYKAHVGNYRVKAKLVGYLDPSRTSLGFYSFTKISKRKRKKR